MLNIDGACIMCGLFPIYGVYKVELVDKEFGIKFMKGKHYNIIPHCLSHTKKAYLFTHFHTTYYLTYLAI
jgi:hypothetical protein